ncbi:MAG: ATP synthase F1 subunit delta [Myxococcota bacterium]|nr:ATP synthase F1 subunit delta [Myxococcota bacterium]
MARGSAAAQRYARALFGLATEASRVDAVRDELAQLLAAIDQSPELGEVLTRPLYPAAQRRAVLASVAQRLGLSPVVSNFCAFLIDQRRTGDLAAIRDEYVRLAEEAAGQVRGEVVSATPLSDAHLARLRAALSRRTGREVELAARVDPKLLAGAIARVGDLVFDGSLRTQLDQLRANLTGGR